MDIEATLRAWIIEAVGASGGSATPLDVAKHVWSRHRVELEAAGDLQYVWQVELRAVAEAMASTGTLTVTGDSWTVTGSAVDAAPRPSGWTDDDIAVAVAAYVSLMRDRDEERPLRRQEAMASVVETTGRTPAAVDALFANVSAVVQEMGFEPLTAYAPRSNVPRGVRQAVREVLAGDD